MHNPPSDIDKILPQGEMLRGFLEQSYLSKQNLFDALRMRGVFTSEKDKSETIPILTTSLISPDEFGFLREQQNTKEDNPKVITQHINWSENKPIIECLPENFELSKVLDLEFSNYSVSGSPDFVPLENDPNHVILDFNIERVDKAKNWANNSNTFSGSVELKRVEEEGHVRIVITHTAEETKSVANEASKSILKHFKDKGHISNNAKLEKILFSAFSNPNRIEYFWSLTKNSTSSILDFSSIVDIEFSPDKSNTLPSGIDWMSQRVDALKIKGESLQDTFFIQEKKYHDYILLYGVDCKFEFSLNGLVGECVISISFPDFRKAWSENAELEVNIKSISFNILSKRINRNQVKKSLMKEIEEQKIKFFSVYRVIENVA